MIDVGDKDDTDRRARAAGRVVVSPETAQRLVDGDLPKGDVRMAARIAGIQAAKRTPELVPFCHPVRLVGSDVAIEVDVEAGVVEITASVRARDRTGVEMEALSAVAVAALTVYDMVKGVEREATIEAVRLLEKTGGAGGSWSAPRGRE